MANPGYNLLTEAENGNNELYVEMIHFVPKTVSAFGFSAAQETKEWITTRKKMTKKSPSRGFFFVYNRTLLVRADKGERMPCLSCSMRSFQHVIMTHI